MQEQAAEREKAGDWARAELLRQKVWEALAAKKPDDSETHEALSAYALNLHQQRKWKISEPLLGKVYEGARTRLEKDDRQAHTLVTLYALALDGLKKHAQAEPVYRDVLAFRHRVLGADDRETANGCGSLGGCLAALGKFDEAGALLQEAIDLRIKTLGAKHADVATGYASLAECLLRQKRFVQAEPAAAKALEIRREVHGEKDPQTLAAMERLVDTLNNMRQYLRAEPLARELLKLRLEAGGEESLDTAAACQHLAGCLFYLARHAEAAPLFARSHEIVVGLHGPENAVAVAFARSFDENYSALIQQLAREAEPKSGGNVNAVLKAVYEKLYPILEECYPADRFPRGHRQLAVCLVKFSETESASGNQPAARRKLEQALAMQRALYPAAEYANGHPDIAYALSSLGKVLHRHGEYEQAKEHCEKSVAMYRKLYPPEKFPAGHADLAAGLVDLAFMYGGGVAGCQLYEEALAMQRKAYPREKFPKGHPDLLNTLNQLGNALLPLKKYERAAECLEEALKMEESLNPSAITMSRGMNQQYLARIYASIGKYAIAEKHLAAGVNVYRRLYPRAKYPQGHLHLADLLWEQGVVLHVDGKVAEAARALLEAESMRNQLAAGYVVEVSEAEALNFAVHHLAVPSTLISAWSQAGLGDEELYRQVWQRRGLLLRLLAGRQQAVLKSTSPQVAELYRQYQVVRKELAQSVLSPAGAEHRAALTQAKERLERELANAAPEFKQQLLARKERLPAELAARLPTNAAFIDLLQYKFTPCPGAPNVDAALKEVQDETACYVAFVLRAGKEPIRVELGPAEPIHRAIAAWRSDIAAGRPGPAASELRRRVWEPLAQHLDGDVTEVYVAPDGALANLPWSALPGQRPSTVLLQTYAFAVVPHGPFLLEQLEREPSAVHADRQTVLLVGDVDYGPLGKTNGAPKTDRPFWPALPATIREIQDVQELAGKRASTLLRGKEADSDAVLKALPQVHVAHLATHGFFEGGFFEKDLFQTAQSDPQPGESQPGEGVLNRHRSTVTARNPFLLSGLVLAGANGRDDQSGAGLLTGEAIAALPLANLELVTLSACDTGLGEVSGGEGVFGLQRAFHQAGAHNVVASLWKVNDQAAAAVMRLFYHKLWVQRRPPLHAMREAQLAIYCHPEQIDALAVDRGPTYDKLVKLVDDKPAQPVTVPVPAPGGDRTRFWAGFVISGGRIGN